MQITFGVKTKTLHELALGKTIIATNHGIAGIKINNFYKNIYKTNKNEIFAKLILEKINSSKFNKNVSNYYSKIYNMKNIVKKFFMENNLKI